MRSGTTEAGEGPSRTYLGEEPPPLPVPQLEVGGAVPLQDLHGCQLLLPLGKGPEKRDMVSTPARGRQISSTSVLPSLPEALLERQPLPGAPQDRDARKEAAVGLSPMGDLAEGDKDPGHQTTLLH